MAVDGFYIDIEDSSGAKQGGGPITSAESWTYTASMDRAGSFAFTMPASAEMADEVQKKRIARAYALLGDTWTEVGAGVIDRITKASKPDGTVLLSVSGDDELRELTNRSVGFLALSSGGNAITHSAAVTAIGAYKPSGWTLTADTSPGHDSIYGRYAGESVLQALVALGEKSQSHFYRSGAKTLTFASTFTSSGVRAIRATGDLADETCAIVDLQERIDTYELITRIYPYGAGQGRARLTLAPTSRTAGSGFTLSTADNYIENDTAEATYGRIERYLEYKDIAPVSNTDADLQAAANMLYDTALEDLKRRSTELEQATYALTLAQCSALLRPLQTLRVVYWDPDAGMDVDADLNILEATLTVDANGLRTTGVVVSTADRWPESDGDIIASEMAQGMVFQSHPQMNANSYTTAYNKNVDADEDATVYFRLGDEVVQVQQVVFDFQLLPFESSVRSVAAPGTTDGSGELTTQDGGAGDTGNSGNDDTGSGGGDDSGSGGGGSTGEKAPDTGGTAPDTGGTAPNTGSTAPNTGSTAPNTGSTAPNTGSTAPETGGLLLPPATGGLLTPPATGEKAPNTGDGGGDNTGSSSPVTGGTSLTTESTGGSTGDPTGGDVISAGQHGHQIQLDRFGFGGDGGTWYAIYYSNYGNELVALDASGGTFTCSLANLSYSGAHTHSVSTHTHTVSSHTHTIAAHTHTTAPHTHTTASHTHTTASHTHTTASHTHTTASHTHTTAAHTHTTAPHTHTTASHTHTTASHTHTTAAHTHTIAAHTHTTAAHTHSLNNHQHAFDVKIDTLFGIYRESSRNTAALTVMEYQVNSGGWEDLSDDVTSLGGDWYRLDVTAAVVDADTLRPLQAANTIEFRIVNQLASTPMLFLSAITVDEGTAVGTILGVNEAAQVGDRIQITNSEDANEDGIHVVTAYDGSELEWRTTGYDASDTGLVCEVFHAYTAQIDGLLSVRNTIQAVAYT